MVLAGVVLIIVSYVIAFFLIAGLLYDGNIKKAILKGVIVATGLMIGAFLSIIYQ